jgi:hypothetical protein
MSNFIHFTETLKIGIKQSFLGDQTRVQVQGDIRDISIIGEGGGLFSSHLAILPQEKPQLIVGNGCQTHFIRGIWQHFALKRHPKNTMVSCSDRVKQFYVSTESMNKG